MGLLGLHNGMRYFLNIYLYLHITMHHVTMEMLSKKYEDFILEVQVILLSILLSDLVCFSEWSVLQGCHSFQEMGVCVIPLWSGEGHGWSLLLRGCLIFASLTITMHLILSRCLVHHPCLVLVPLCSVALLSWTLYLFWSSHSLCSFSLKWEGFPDSHGQ